ncbi:MAG: integrase domain-containing protein, partial [Gammaproteobacteria bacterium]|nr:integrase domain-containing protein [Gammaproteobacteria bacterium]
TKGGKERTVPIRNAEQQALLDRIKRQVGNGSLIPADRSYVQQLRVYERLTANAGLSRMHGLRHAYAQQRYQELTGWLPPAAGGPTSRQLSPEQRLLDQQARLTISHQLGHARIQIVSVYLAK